MSEQIGSDKKGSFTMKMRPSRVLRVMREGKVAICIKANLRDSRFISIAAMCGFDAVWIDFEHVPQSMDLVEQAVNAAAVYDTDILTRVARGPYSNLIQPFEADSAGIMVPHLMSLEDAKQVQYYTKFHPIGRRPIDGGNADGKFTLVDANRYMEEANRERFVIVQIEDPEPVPEIEEIAALPGIDMLFFGPADFTQGAGIPNQFDHPLVAETRELVAKVARRHGKFAGTVGGIGNFKALVALGYNFISIGADVVALANYCREIVDACHGHEAATL